jgi:hypothetical protein
MTVVVPASVMPVPVAVMPAHLLRLQAVDLVTRGDGRMRIAWAVTANVAAPAATPKAIFRKSLRSMSISLCC